MHRRVILTDAYGDTHHGNARLNNESYWVITVGATSWFEDVWADEGWVVASWGDWEL